MALASPCLAWSLQPRHPALVSSLISLSKRMATRHLPAAALAAEEILPILHRVHMAPALTSQVDTSQQYRPTTLPSRYSGLLAAHGSAEVGHTCLGTGLH